MPRRKLNINTDKISWVTNTARFTNGEVGKVGKWLFFSLYWDGSTPRELRNGRDYKLQSFLPGIKNNLGNYTKENGKKKAEEVFKYWFKLLGVK